MLVYEFESYKEFLKSYIKENKKPGIIGELANASGCDRSYLSQIFNSKVQLTPDHLNGICEFLDLNEEEENYLTLLLLYERASDLNYKKKLEFKIKQTQNRKLSVSEKITSESIDLNSEYLKMYYSSWIYSAIHILSSNNDYQTPESIAQKLNLKISKVKKCLDDLRKHNLVSFDGKKYKHNGQNLHLAIDSPLVLQNHLNWRVEAVKDSDNKDSLHYTSVFTVSKSHIKDIKKNILKLIENKRKLVTESGTEELCVFCCDFFRFD